jgi:hypothetical protein
MVLMHDSALFGTLMGEGVSCVESLELVRQDARVEAVIISIEHVSCLVSDAMAFLGNTNHWILYVPSRLSTLQAVN